MPLTSGRLFLHHKQPRACDVKTVERLVALQAKKQAIAIVQAPLQLRRIHFNDKIVKERLLQSSVLGHIGRIKGNEEALFGHITLAEFIPLGVPIGRLPRTNCS